MSGSLNAEIHVYVDPKGDEHQIQFQPGDKPTIGEGWTYTRAVGPDGEEYPAGNKNLFRSVDEHTVSY